MNTNALPPQIWRAQGWVNAQQVPLRTQTSPTLTGGVVQPAPQVQHTGRTRKIPPAVYCG